MALLKCKMCGGNLEVSDNVTVCECEYCGTKQTLPKNHDDVLTNLFNRANNLRIKCEFDKAQEIYEKIVGSNPDEAEAYWGIILCKYGIEYVEDPATFTKVPTCHRTQLESVRSDTDYLSALEHADAVQKGVYEKEAEAIDRLQKDILEIVHNEEPFDVFICYKESDESGKRTPDSVIANDIYHQLTAEGFKVFYAAITLEDKLGQAYEPYIFAALNSAKVMLSIGTKPEYFNAVWVRNEWSRFLKIMKNDRSKLLIPCYKDMDAYDLPEEFSHLQAQDMSKIGFINDVIRGIKKVLVKDEPKVTVVQQNVVTNENTFTGNTASLLKRTFMFIEDGDWKSADEYCEKVLDIDPECSQAYICKLMVHARVHQEEELANSTTLLSLSNHFQKARRFSDAATAEKLDFYNNRSWYNAGMVALSKADSKETYEEAKQYFDNILDFEDAAQKSELCQEKIYYYIFLAIKSKYYYARTDREFMAMAEELEKISVYAPAAEKREYCIEQAEIYSKYELKYQSGRALLNSYETDDLKRCMDIFSEILSYKDSEELYKRAETRYTKITRTAEYEAKMDAIRDEKRELSRIRQNLGFFDTVKKNHISQRMEQLSKLESELKSDYADVASY